VCVAQPGLPPDWQDAIVVTAAGTAMLVWGILRVQRTK